mmetsp:Transcript_11333/g.31280  ORF Transcript_11333/g.31280 Transcript_11333/m.31280 type:complete len:365 (-) Transcript_11333:6258-7352(-)
MLGRRCGRLVLCGHPVGRAQFDHLEFDLVAQWSPFGGRVGRWGHFDLQGILYPRRTRTVGAEERNQQQQRQQEGHRHHIVIGNDNRFSSNSAFLTSVTPYNHHYSHEMHAPQQQQRQQNHSQPQQNYRIEIGAPPPTERMEGVTQDPESLGPLVVIDGANVAYAYADALGGGGGGGSSYGRQRPAKIEPDIRGIEVACQYFASIRVLVVLPASYYRIKPRASSGGTNHLMETDSWEILQRLKQQGKLVMAPPTDDDDSYVITIALREHYRRRRQNSSSAAATMGAFCLSNDLYRDAQERNAQLGEWLANLPRWQGGRISFAFVDLGRLDDHGQRLLDIVPNPRHPLVSLVEHQQQQQNDQNHHY